ENRQVQLIRPPVSVREGPMRRGGRGGDYWAFAFAAAVRHDGPSPVSLLPSDGSLLLTLVVAGRERCCRDTLGASAPVDDLGFVDLVARVVGGRQAWGV